MPMLPPPPRRFFDARCSTRRYAAARGIGVYYVIFFFRYADLILR